VLFDAVRFATRMCIQCKAFSVIVRVRGLLFDFYYVRSIFVRLLFIVYCLLFIVCCLLFIVLGFGVWG